MQLHNPDNPGSAEEHDAIWELIPWYVNGSLPEEQAQMVKDYSLHNTACAQEIERQRRLAEGVVKVDPFEAPLSRSWEHLRAQIEAEDRARTPKAGARGRFAGLQGGLIALASAVSVACLVLVIQPFDNSFETLTSGGEEVLPTVRFQLSPGVDPAALDALLAQVDATLVSGPSDAGVYTATLAAEADTQATADALMALPEVLFAAPQGAQ